MVSSSCVDRGPCLERDGGFEHGVIDGAHVTSERSDGEVADPSF